MSWVTQFAIGMTTCILAASSWLDGGALAAVKPLLASQAKAAVLMDATSGTVLFAKNEHARLPIASVTKVATMLLTLEAVERGQVSFRDMIRTSDYAAGMGGSQIYLEPGEKMSLGELLKGIAVASANDAAVAVAEHIAGSESNFVAMMNAKVKELGLHDTHFVNPNGLPNPHHYSSAYDIALLSRELMKHEQITKFTALYSDHLRKGSDRPFWLVNTNKLIRFYPGMDGIKTGFTADAKFCLAATAKRNHFRAIGVVLGEPTSKIRNGEVTEMMNYAFSHYDTKIVYAKGQVVTLAPVMRGEQQAVGVASARAIGLLVDKVDQTKQGAVVTELRPLQAPVKKGQIAGHVRVVDKGAVLATVPLLVTADVAKITWVEMVGRALRSTFLLGTER